ncbi:MAG: hypothetical protein EBZ77_16825, partial [Chitinophagia bacterium]|nr:hypothetical protein [Chitinophagia bacterium]
MNKLLLFATFLMLPAMGWAQPGRTVNQPTTFNEGMKTTGIKNFIRLPYGELTLELKQVSDYNQLHHLDSLLVLLERDIAFYRDSLDKVQPANVRIDYQLDTPATRQLRFRTTAPGGDRFVIRNGETARVKAGNDTICLWLAVPGEHIYSVKDGYSRGMADAMGAEGRTFMLNTTYYIRVTMCLNYYSDLRKVLRDLPAIYKAMDTLQQALPKRSASRAVS